MLCYTNSGGVYSGLATLLIDTDAGGDNIISMTAEADYDPSQTPPASITDTITFNPPIPAGESVLVYATISSQTVKGTLLQQNGDKKVGTFTRVSTEYS